MEKIICIKKALITQRIVFRFIYLHVNANTKKFLFVREQILQNKEYTRKIYTNPINSEILSYIGIILLQCLLKCILKESSCNLVD